MKVHCCSQEWRDAYRGSLLPITPVTFCPELTLEKCWKLLGSYEPSKDSADTGCSSYGAAVTNVVWSLATFPAYVFVILQNRKLLCCVCVK